MLSYELGHCNKIFLSSFGNSTLSIKIILPEYFLASSGLLTELILHKILFDLTTKLAIIFSFPST